MSETVTPFRAFEARPEELTLDGISRSLAEHLPQAVRIHQIEALLQRLGMTRAALGTWESKIGKTHGVTCRRAIETIAEQVR